MAANFLRQPNGYIYLFHWIDTDTPFRVSTKIKIATDKWDKKNQMPKDRRLKFDNNETVVSRLSRYRSALTNALIEVNVTRGDLKEAFYSFLPGIKRGGSVVKPGKFMEFYKSCLDEYRETKRTNYLSYQTTFRILTDFFGRENPTFDQMDMKFYKNFQMYLEKKGLSQNYIWAQWRNIKSIMHTAYKYKLTTNAEFNQFKAKQEKPVNIYLTLSELDKIYNLNLKNHPGLSRTRDLFIIGAFTGLRFQDWGRVSSDLIKDGVLRVQSHKTNEVSQIPVHKYVTSILLKYGGVLPKISSNQKTNAALKLIGKAARLNQVYEIVVTKGGKRKSKPDKYKKCELITTHTARRSLCTNLIIEGANPYDVMKISGHADIKSFSRYISLNELDAVANLQKLKMFK